MLRVILGYPSTLVILIYSFVVVILFCVIAQTQGILKWGETISFSQQIDTFFIYSTSHSRRVALISGACSRTQLNSFQYNFTRATDSELYGSLYNKAPLSIIIITVGQLALFECHQHATGLFPLTSLLCWGPLLSAWVACLSSIPVQFGNSALPRWELWKVSHATWTHYS